MNSQCFHNCSNIALSMNSLYLHTRGSAIHCNGSRHKTNTNFEAKCNIIFVSVGLTKPSLCATFVAFQPQKKQDAKCHACYGLQKSSCKASAFLFQASFWVRQCTPTVAKHLFAHNATDSDTRGRMCICIYVHTICSTYVFSLYVYTYSWLTYLQTYTHMRVGHWNSEHLVRRRILANRYNWFMMEVKDECSQPEAS